MQQNVFLTVLLSTIIIYVAIYKMKLFKFHCSVCLRRPGNDVTLSFVIDEVRSTSVPSLEYLVLTLFYTMECKTW